MGKGQNILLERERERDREIHCYIICGDRGGKQIKDFAKCSRNEIEMRPNANSAEMKFKFILNARV